MPIDKSTATKQLKFPAGWRIGRFWPLGPRVEDPIRIKFLSDALQELKWDKENARSSLEVVFERISHLTHAEIRYYYSHRKRAGQRAAAFRLLAWVLGTIGLLVPLMQPFIEDIPVKNPLALGFLAIGLAGAFVVADSVFSGSEGQARYVTAQLALEKAYAQFAIDWQCLLVTYDNGPDAQAARACLNRVLTYLQSLYGSLDAETAEWKNTLAKVQAQLQQMSQKPPHS